MSSNPHPTRSAFVRLIGGVQRFVRDVVSRDSRDYSLKTAWRQLMPLVRDAWQTFSETTLARAARGARAWTGVFFILALLAVGTGGYMYIEGVAMVDAIYMTVITISTVGFGEVIPLSPSGRWFTIFLILSGATLLAYAFSTIVDFVVSGALAHQFERRRRRNMLAKLNNHSIVCGYGRMGRSIAQGLIRERRPFVIIDTDEAVVNALNDDGHIALCGSASDEGILHEAGILRARHLVASVASDAENVFITLTAKSLNPTLFVVSRANYQESEPKLRRAGANEVILPYDITGRRVVNMLLRPHITQFLDDVLHSEGVELIFEQVELPPDSELVGRSLAASDIRSRTGVSVVAVNAPGEPITTSPDPLARLEVGTKLIVLGTRDQLIKLRAVVGVEEE